MPKVAAMSVQTISGYAFEVRIRFIVVFLSGMWFGCSFDPGLFGAIASEMIDAS
jgi:hypothetical protein